jgi:hypothetical protein
MHADKSEGTKSRGRGKDGGDEIREDDKVKLKEVKGRQGEWEEE